MGLNAVYSEVCKLEATTACAMQGPSPNAPSLPVGIEAARRGLSVETLQGGAAIARQCCLPIATVASSLTAVM